jgi:hypothetical protein
MRWDAYAGKFHKSDTHSFARPAKRMEQAGVESSA